MQVHNIISSDISIRAQAIKKVAELRAHREELQKVNHENIQHI